ncbi:hypothetical protein CUJ84_pRLN3000223 (plasmid) [Rhizobium leguminosarum]|uniref:Uncharacterized protein n=1 Tax=Rhizobium leguminosarum TaxID=384 RepID=A0A2K9ZGG8_RHILE|nr:hypothetical protein CUJ84_pRLN3000223 [Rhizobium leguminosarum]
MIRLSASWAHFATQPLSSMRYRLHMLDIYSAELEWTTI